MQDAAKFWDGIAERYARSPIKDMDAYSYTLERTKTYLSASDRVLEIGCGTGSTALLLAPGVGEIIASDISPNMVAIGARKAREQGIANARFVAADLFDSKLDGEPYDTVLAHNLLHLVRDVPAAIRRVHGLLKPGGMFISKTVCLPERGTALKFRLMRAVLPVVQALGKAPYVNFMRIAELEGAITEAGFKIVETGNHPAAPPPSRYIVARKI